MGQDPRRDASASPLVRDLLAWFARARRPLPWRKDRDPYRIWIAEVLLQQTRVAQAVRYFDRFVRRFPGVRELAAAREEDVLKAWEGAGYYARARHLHRAARLVVSQFGGELPRSSAELERLPGTGPYIAAAVASLAFDEAIPALEANAIRVAARWTLERDDPRRPAVRARLRVRLAELLPRDAPGAFNEAVMELGETVCLPRTPDCPACPVAAHCRARQELPDPGSVPVRGARPPKPHVSAAMAAVERGDGRWLVLRRPSTGLLGGLWEFPGGKLRAHESPSAACRREVREETGLALASVRRAGIVRHGYSHFSVELHLYRARPRGHAAPRTLGREWRWVTPEEFASLPRPRATEKAVELLLRSPGEATGARRAGFGRPARSAETRRREPERAAPPLSPRRSTERSEPSGERPRASPLPVRR